MKRAQAQSFLPIILIIALLGVAYLINSGQIQLPTFAVTGTCSDSDGTNYNKGTVTLNGQTYTDVCVTAGTSSTSRGTYTEMTCALSNNVYVVGKMSATCPTYAPYCKDGGCTASTTSTPTTCTATWSTGSWSTCSSSGTQTRTVTQTNTCSDTSNKPATSQSCTPPSTTTPTVTCSDSDGSTLTSVGTVKDSTGSYTDSCASTTSVYEYTCYNNLMKKTTTTCPSSTPSCSSGKCVTSTTTTPSTGTCTDYDGNDPYTASYTMSTSGAKNDYCGGTNFNSVNEQLCSGSSQTTQLTLCPTGKCLTSGGRGYCEKATTVTPPPTAQCTADADCCKSTECGWQNLNPDQEPYDVYCSATGSGTLYASYFDYTCSAGQCVKGTIQSSKAAMTCQYGCLTSGTVSGGGVAGGDTCKTQSSCTPSCKCSTQTITGTGSSGNLITGSTVTSFTTDILDCTLCNTDGSSYLSQTICSPTGTEGLKCDATAGKCVKPLTCTNKCSTKADICTSNNLDSATYVSCYDANNDGCLEIYSKTCSPSGTVCKEGTTPNTISCVTKPTTPTTPTTPTPTCTETDGGKVFTKKGTTTDSTGSYTDYCSGTSVVEYYCSGTAKAVGTYGCSTDGSMKCLDGACVSTTTPPTTCTGTLPSASCSGDLTQVLGYKWSSTCQAQSYVTDTCTSGTEECSGSTHTCVPITDQLKSCANVNAKKLVIVVDSAGETKGTLQSIATMAVISQDKTEITTTQVSTIKLRHDITEDCTDPQIKISVENTNLYSQQLTPSFTNTYPLQLSTGVVVNAQPSACTEKVYPVLQTVTFTSKIPGDFILSSGIYCGETLISEEDTFSVTVTGPICGNGIIETGQVCDGQDFGGKSCASEGYAEGTGQLLCTNNCGTIDKSGCSPAEKTCSDGTPYNSCSAETRGKQCVNGKLIATQTCCSEIGLSVDVGSDSCVETNKCTFGTDKYTCVSGVELECSTSGRWVSTTPPTTCNREYCKLDGCRTDLECVSDSDCATSTCDDGSTSQGKCNENKCTYPLSCPPPPPDPCATDSCATGCDRTALPKVCIKDADGTFKQVDNSCTAVELKLEVVQDAFCTSNGGGGGGGDKEVDTNTLIFVGIAGGAFLLVMLAITLGRR